MTFAHPEYLISAEELSAKLESENLRIFDCAVHLIPNPKGGYQAESGQGTYDEGHVPGAAFLNQVAQLSDTSSALGFTRLPDSLLIQAFADAGINADCEVVFYSSGLTMWATRAWWLLHYCGHQRVAILDGGIEAWKEAGLGCSVESNTYASENWTSSVLPHRFVDQSDVVSAIDDARICTVNALSPEVYAGTGNHHYGRRGHIPNSVNVFYNSMLEDGKFRAPAVIRESLATAGLLDDRRIITYCGGGISATIDSFACLLLGKEDVAVYDGSMSEWVMDESLPLVEGNDP
ncbi:MAG: sulfurtransferase [Gammaproteobacteria bacterium]|mgnify:CR=1 FL=1|nr:sulfurtransferase [Gammaproteobacteria bacterium]MBT7370762.1 sulfurtransferase [Gammaproteobacteria bacterium]